jgi:hypothetical protein
MTLLVHRQIKKFRLANNMSQKNLRRLSVFPMAICLILNPGLPIPQPGILLN